MANSPTRDNSMYHQLDEDYIRSVKKERRQRNFALNDYLPNSLKRDASIGKISNDAVSQGSATKMPPQNLTLSRVPTGRASNTMNRLASLTNLSVAKGSIPNKTGVSPSD